MESDPLTAPHDVIIIGAGSAGCVLAERLSLDPALRVLVVEAGPRDRHPLLRVPKGFGKVISDERLAWHYPVPSGGPAGRTEAWVRGRTLGGSSSINGMIYNRGAEQDYADLAEVAGPTWGWDSMLPAFRAIEDHALGESPTRGAGGPLHVSPHPDMGHLGADVIAAAVALGLSGRDDVNDGDGGRVGPAIRTIKNGTRVSAARAFLHPALTRPNLTVLTDTEVRRLLFVGDRVVGVLARHRGGDIELRANQVVLSAGGLQTPKILELSGIGNPDVLKPIGIDVRVPNQRLGEGMREHRCVALQFRLRSNEGYNRHLSTIPRQTVTAARYLASRRGPLAGGAYDVVGFVDTAGGSARPDAQFLMGPFSALPYKAHGKLGVERQPGAQVIGYALRPTSAGSIHVTGSDDRSPLHIEPHFLETEHDRAVTTRLFRHLRELFGTEPLASHIDHESRPGASTVSDAEILDAALDDGYCGYHAVGTAATGLDRGSVVDETLQVRGVDGLSALDASVLPTMVSGNLNGPLMAMAWMAAPMIQDRC